MSFEKFARRILELPDMKCDAVDYQELCNCHDTIATLKGEIAEFKRAMELLASDPRPDLPVQK